MAEDDDLSPRKARTPRFKYRHGGQQGIRDALLVIARSAACPMPHSSAAPGLCTPTKSVALSEHETAATGFITPAARRRSSRQSGGSPAVSQWSPQGSGIAAVRLESPVRRRKTALAELQSAKLELARALEQLRDCAGESPARPPPDAARNHASDQKEAAP